MNKRTIMLKGVLKGAFVALFIVSGSLLGAQPLLDNEFYREAERLRNEAEEALNDGDFELSIERSQQSQELSERAYQEAEDIYYSYVARASKTRAENALDSADRSGRAYNEEERIILEDARAFYRDGVSLLDEEQHELSALSFLNVLAVLDAGGIVELTDEEVDSLVQQGIEIVEEMADEEISAMDSEGEALPRFYKVRLIPEDRDSFSKIAAYPFVYGDYTKWPILYERNKDKIVDSENPDLIHPDQLFEIPSIAGETREGEWQPSAEE